MVSRVLLSEILRKKLDSAVVRDVNSGAISSKDRKPMSATAIVNGEIIKSLRKDRFITQSRLAEMAGIRPESLCRLEKGKPAKFATILKLANALGVEPQSLISKE